MLDSHLEQLHRERSILQTKERMFLVRRQRENFTVFYSGQTDMINNLKFKKSLLGILILGVCGCETPYRKNYFIHRSVNKQNYESSKKYSIIIKPTLDRRPEEKKDYSALLIIPVLPFVKNQIEYPETLGYDFRSRIDIPNALFKEFNSYNKLKNLEISINDDVKDSDYFLTSELKVAREIKYQTLYGFSFLGIYLWLLFPYEYCNFRLEIKYSLINSKTREIVIQRNFLKKDSDFNVIYSDPERLIPKLLSETVNEFSKETIRTLEAVR